METVRYLAKKRLQELPKNGFEELVDGLLLSETEKEILSDIYVKKLPLWEIGNRHGYSESGIKKIHSRLLKKIIKHL